MLPRLPKQTQGSLPGRASAGQSAGSHVIVLLSIPALVLLRQTNAIFNDAKSIDSSNFVDSWLYLGFFRNFVDFKRYLFTDTYYASRMSWILPGWLVYQVFSPEIANYVLHLSVFYLFVFSLYFAVSRLAHPRAALVAALAAGFTLTSGVRWDRTT